MDNKEYHTKLTRITTLFDKTSFSCTYMYHTEFTYVIGTRKFCRVL